MFVDLDAYFSDGQALTATAASTQYIDLQTTGDIDKLRLIIGVAKVRTNTGATTCDIIVQQDTATNFGSPETIYTFAQLAAASFDTAGQLFNVAMPNCTKRYVRLYYTVGTQNFTVLEIDAYLTPAAQTNKG